MARIKVELPEQFAFSTTIPVRITDLNYGKHVGNDTILSMIHEARVQYLRQLGYGELELEFGRNTGLLTVRAGNGDITIIGWNEFFIKCLTDVLVDNES